MGTLDLKKVIDEINDVLGQTEDGVPIHLIRRSEPEGDGIFYEKITRYASAIDRLAPPRSRYHKMADDALTRHDPPRNSRQTAERLKAILYALKEDLNESLLRSTEELIHSDLLSDFLEMAIRLIEDGFKDPAAVLAGTVLAEHLRRMCGKYEIELGQERDGKTFPKNVESMIEDLYSFQVFPSDRQRALKAWNKIRIKALLGEKEAFTTEQVINMISGMRTFIADYPA